MIHVKHCEFTIYHLPMRQNWGKYYEIYRQMCGNTNISFVIGIDNLTRNHSNNLRPLKPTDDIEYE